MRGIRVFGLAAVLLPLLAWGEPAFAQAYPAKAVTMVVPFPPVVTSDTIENVCITLFALEETAQLHWRAAQLGKVEAISNSEVRSVMTGHRYEEFFSHVWGHYEALDPWNGK
jgi:hypothetical protein